MKRIRFHSSIHKSQCDCVYSRVCGGRQKRPLRWRGLCVFLGAWMLACGASVGAQSGGTADEIRGFILLRLAGQIYWSPSSDLSQRGTPYRLCIYRNPEFYERLRELVRGHQSGTKPVQLIAANELSDLGQCHVAYVGDISPGDIDRIVSSGLLSKTVFVASSDQSAAAGLHIRLYLGESDTFDIEVNRSAFALGDNEPSASFIKLAGKVYDGVESGGGAQ